MTLYGVPLNILVVSVFLSIHKIGTVGAMSIAALELLVATICMIRLRHLHNNDMKKLAKRRWGCVKAMLKVANTTTNAISYPVGIRRLNDHYSSFSEE